MRREFIHLLAVITVVSGWGCMELRAQGPVPQTYSFTQDPGYPLMGPSVIKVSRDGSKEVVEQTISAGPGRDKGYHAHLIYDFQTHKLYTQVLSDPGSPCGVQDFNDPAAPSEFDIISGAADMMKQLSDPKNPARRVGTETLNGFPSDILAFSSPQARGKVWVTQKGGYPIKLVLVDKDGKATTFYEVKQLSFSRPPASVFAVPGGCAQAAAAMVGKPATNVTALTLQKIGNYTGPCPAHIKMAGTITVDGPGKVFYQFGAGNMEPGETLTFTAAGTKTVTHVMTLKPEYGDNMGGSAILQAIGEDADGKHGIPTQGSNNSDFNITCTSGGGK